MVFSAHTFQFRLVPTLIFAIPAPLLAALGLWQFDRAEYKGELLKTMETRRQMAPLQIGSAHRDAAPLLYRQLLVEGHYQEQGQLVIENRRHAGRTGFHVITPLRLRDSQSVVLVNRGWVAAAADGTPPEIVLPTGVQRLLGEAYLPREPALNLHRGLDIATAWGRRWPYLSMELYTGATDTPVQPFVLLLDAGSDGGYLREWPRELPKVGMHLGYAIQWFVFAVAALAFYLKLSLVPKRRGQEGAHE